MKFKVQSFKLQPNTPMKTKLILITLVAICGLSSCSWDKGDWQRLAEATGKAALTAGAMEAQSIQVDKTSGK